MKRDELSGAGGAAATNIDASPCLEIELISVYPKIALRR
jgi:hypothetical protein